MGSAQLLQQWVEGDAGAGSALVRRHFTAIYRFVRRRVGPAAEDLTQRTFEAALAQSDRFKKDLSFRAYLLGIARNQTLMYLRKEAAVARRRVYDDGSHPGPTLSLGARVDARREHKLLLSAMQTLPIELQITLELFYWEELTSREIATILDISMSTVTSRLWRARTALRTALETMDVSQELLRTTMANMESWARSVRALVDADQG